jgi:hypothetical protein
MTQPAMELMSEAGRGHVVTVTSGLVDQPMTGVPAASVAIWQPLRAQAATVP